MAENNTPPVNAEESPRRWTWRDWVGQRVEIETLVPDYPPVQGRLLDVKQYELVVQVGRQTVAFFKHGVLSVRPLEE